MTALLRVVSMICCGSNGQGRRFGRELAWPCNCAHCCSGISSSWTCRQADAQSGGHLGKVCDTHWITFVKCKIEVLGHKWLATNSLVLNTLKSAVAPPRSLQGSLQYCPCPPSWIWEGQEKRREEGKRKEGRKHPPK